MVHRGPAWRQAREGAQDTDASSWRELLRARTREAHEALDRALTGPDGRVTDRADYVRTLQTLHALHRWSEGRLRTWTETSHLASALPHDLVLPDRADLYAGDLQALGERVPEVDPADAVVDDADGVALLYLLGGSTAGARVLLRGLPDEVPRAARRGLTDAAGPEATRMWHAVRAFLAAPAPEPLGDRAADVAHAYFAALRALAEERAA